MQQIIVYRNPMEAAFWNSVSDGQGWPIIAGIAMFFVVFLLLNHISDRVVYKYFYWKRESFVFKYRKHYPSVSLFLGAAAGFVTLWKLWIF